MSSLKMFLFGGLGVAQLQPGKALGIAFLLLSLLATLIVQSKEPVLEIEQVAVHGILIKHKEK